MNVTKHPSSAPPTTARSGAEQVRRAWLGLLLFPISLAVAFVIGEGLYSLFGYDPSAGAAPLGVELACTVPALVVFAVPAAVSTWYARRGAEQGDRRGWLPSGFAWAIVAWFLVMNIISAFVGAAPD